MELITSSITSTYDVGQESGDQLHSRHQSTNSYIKLARRQRIIQTIYIFVVNRTHKIHKMSLFSVVHEKLLAH